MNIPNEQVDVLAFSPHPDDVEIFCGGTLISLANRGHRVGVVDMTRSELSTGGDLDSRQKETTAASKVMGLALRHNMEFPDGGIHAHSKPEDDNSQLVRVVEAIRTLKPEIVLLPYSESRHPDHSATSNLVERALFFAGVKKFAAHIPAPKHTPLQALQYQMRFTFEPSFIVDTSNTMERKFEAIRCYSSQVVPNSANPEDQTLLNSPLSLSSIDARDRFYGSMIGSTAGEPLFTTAKLRIEDPLEYFRNNNNNKAQFFQRGV